MGIINVLDISVANLIAAGEVVERPANAVKELVENAVDAGATEITVEIIGGGVASLRVTDNGCGMSNEDAVVAVRRHATSKLKKAEDLAAIMTLGFRGEALAAITAVSEFRIMTKRREDSEGTLLSGKYGTVESVAPEGCPDGTTIICEKLFAATPARLKFLKSNASEGAAVAGVVEKLAVSRPEIAFRFISDGILKFSTRGDGNLKNAIYSVYGGTFAKNLIAVQHKSGGVEVTGFTSSPENLRGNRGMQQFFINERCVRSKTLTAALEAAYRSYMPTGKFPSCVLNLKISAALVDVNIHPAKLEVKFSDEKAVFDALFGAVRNALNVGIARPTLDITEIAEKTEKREKLQNLFSEAEEKGEKSEHKEIPKSIETQKPIETPKLTVTPAPKPEPVREKTQIKLSFEDDDLPVDVPILPKDPPPSFRSRFGTETSVSGFDYMSRLYASAIRTADPIPEPKEEPKIPAPSIYVPDKSDQTEEKEPIISEKTHAQIPRMETKPIPAYRIVGEVFASYIIVAVDEKMLLIDKHAAHERINFERLRANMTAEAPHIQLLLTPEILSVSEEEAAVAAEYEKELSACGYELKISEKEIALSGIPFGFEKNDAVTLFVSILEEAKNGIPVEHTKQNAFEAALYQSSCKASVKAGRLYDEAHIRWICDNLFRYDCIKFCPHGRPVAFELSKKELDTHFGRT
ncbi:MAG: DNA mismatch repair endonuclease MutL [Clostridia bacterium]|nr:DNA mismatch repair endonuclease MutL [Clostridia bacterium]